MLLIPQHLLMSWIAAGFWPFLRITGVFLTAPILGSSTIPVFHRVIMTVLFAACLAAWAGPWPPLPSSLMAIVYDGTIQIAFGALIGIVGKVIVSSISSAGEIAGAAIGSNFASTVGLSQPENVPTLSGILYWAGFMVYLGAGGMFWTIAVVAHSFKSCPSGIPTQAALHAIALYTGVILSDGVILALPALAAALALNIAIGLANALSPNLNIFSVGFPILFLGGVWVVGSSIFFVEPMVGHLMLSGGQLLSSLVRTTP